MIQYFLELCILVLIVGTENSRCDLLRSMYDDILAPYLNFPAAKYSHNAIRSVQSKQFGNSTYETWKAHVSSAILPVANTSYFVSDVYENMWTKHHVYGHYTEIRNPLEAFAVLEPLPSGCKHNSTSTVMVTSKSRNCIVAQNGGFFNTHTGACVGNVVSDGEIVRDAKGVINAHFGITKNGSILTGYFSESDLYKLDFQQLIGGVIWLVRNGSSFVEESIRLENREAEETGTLRYFADVISARTAIGHDHAGRIVFVHIDGQTGVRGANLKGFARFLIEELHVVNAINLDGGGSATFVLNGSLASYPSDHCVGAPMWRCARPISTVICAHEPECTPKCVNGNCVLGKCACNSNFIGKSCDTLFCGSKNCSRHGVCKSDGCHCNPGWHGSDCRHSCPSGTHGVDCSQRCVCENGSKCDAATGYCHCAAGFKGKACDQVCPAGTYGRNCRYSCHCSKTCACDPKTGVCSTNLTDIEQVYLNVSRCLAKKLFSPPDQSQESYDLSMLRLLCIATAALMLSLLFNVLVMWKYVGSNRDEQHTSYLARSYPYFSATARDSDSTSDSFSDEEEESEEESTKIKAFLLNCLQFRAHQYSKLHSNDEVYEMNNLEN